uniref:Dynein axonemal assembly factor 6 n=1 Tax=Sphenodon punctatus TaxID=8508 RepID=A0A8D0HU89_SPHPU
GPWGQRGPRQRPVSPASLACPPPRGAPVWAPAPARGGAWSPLAAPDLYEILFKQKVGAEDIFLGMSRKDPSTACCEEMLIKIKLPDSKASDILLDVQEKILDLRTPKIKLLLHLPHPVDNKSGKACFLSEKETLEVTLRMRRDLDFINFA